MSVQLDFPSFIAYYTQSFSSDFKRLGSKFSRESFSSEVEEWFYASSYVVQAALQKHLDFEGKTLEPIDLSHYGERMQVAFAIACSYAFDVFGQKLEDSVRERVYLPNKMDLLFPAEDEKPRWFETDDCERFVFNNFEAYFNEKLKSDLLRLHGGNPAGKFDDLLEEYCYAGASLACAAFKNFLPVPYGNPFDKSCPIDYEAYKAGTLLDTAQCMVLSVMGDAKSMATAWGLAAYELEEGADCQFCVLESDLGKELFDCVSLQFQSEQQMSDEINAVEFPIHSDGFSYAGPYPKGYFWGILNVVEKSVEDDRELIVLISMPTLEDAIRLFCKVLWNANVTKLVEVQGKEGHAYRFELTYSPEGCSATITHFCDDVEFIESLIKQVNARLGQIDKIAYDGCWNFKFPRDDAEVMEYLRSGDLSAFYEASEFGPLCGLQDRAPDTYGDMLQLCAGFMGTGEDDFRVEQACNNVYALAYLIVHYGVKVERTVKTIEIPDPARL